MTISSLRFLLVPESRFRRLRNIQFWNFMHLKGRGGIWKSADFRVSVRLRLFFLDYGAFDQLRFRWREWGQLLQQKVAHWEQPNRAGRPALCCRMGLQKVEKVQSSQRRKAVTWEKIRFLIYSDRTSLMKPTSNNTLEPSQHSIYNSKAVKHCSQASSAPKW